MGGTTMELRSYWRIIARRWWLPVGLTLLTGILTLVMQKPWQERPAAYSATMRFNVGVQPERIPGVYTYDRYYTLLTSEYLVDDLGEIVKSGLFAGAVSKRLADRSFGAVEIGTQLDIFGNAKRCSTLTVVTFPCDNKVVPVAAFILTRVLPLLNGVTAQTTEL